MISVKYLKTSTSFPEKSLVSGSHVSFWRHRKVYPPNTLHHICCGIMKYVGQNGQPDIDFFKDPVFGEFKSSLDAEMKRLQSKGVGSKKRQAEPLTEDEEEKLWETQQLRAHSPQSLVITIFTCVGCILL